MHVCFVFHRKEDVEAKYYADGEDAFAMRRDLAEMAEKIEQEKQDRRLRAQARAKAASQAQTQTHSSADT